jgi:uncharacterized protein YukE
MFGFIGKAVSSVVDTAKDIGGDAVQAAEAVGGAVVQGAEAVGGAAVGAANGIAQGVVQLGGDAEKVAAPVLHAVVTGTMAMGQGVTSAYHHVIQTWGNTAGNIVDTYKHLGNDVVQAGSNLVHGNIGGAWDSAKSFAGDLVNGTIKTDEGLATGILQVGGDAVHMAAGMDKAAVQAGTAVLSGVIGNKAADGLLHAAENGADAVGQGVTSAYHHVIQTWENTAGNIADTYKHLGNDVVSAASNLAHGNLGGAWDSAKNFAGDLVNGTVQTDKGLMTGAYQVVTDAGHMAVGVDKAAVDAAGAVGSAILGSPVGKAAQGVLHAAGDGAVALGQGVASAYHHVIQGWENAAGSAVDTYKHLGGDVVSAASDLAHGNLGGAWGSAKNFGSDLVNGTIQTDKDLATGILNVINDAGHMASGIDHAAVNAVGAVLGAVSPPAHAVSGAIGAMGSAVAQAAVGDASPSHDTSSSQAVSGAIGAIGNAVAHAAVGNASPTHGGGIFNDVANAVAHAVGVASPTHTGGVFGDIASAVANSVGVASPTHTGGVFGDIASAVANSVGVASPPHGNIFTDAADTIAHAVAAAGGEASLWHKGGILSDIGNAVANATQAVANAVGNASHTRGNVLTDAANTIAHAAAAAAGEASPSHSGGILSDIASAVAHAVGTASPTHATGNVLTDGLAGAAQAVANAVGTAGTHGGSFWDQAADAIHHATGSAGLASLGAVNVSPQLVVTPPAPAADLHSTGLAGGLGDVVSHLSDTIHLGAETAHVAQENHAYPQFEVPALHLTEFALHH